MYQDTLERLEAPAQEATLSLAECERRLAGLTKELDGHVQCALAKMVEIGEVLLSVKELLYRNGEFAEWRRKQCVWSAAQCDMFMRFARFKGDLNYDLPPQDNLEMLRWKVARPTLAPAAVIEKAIALHNEGASVAVVAEQTGLPLAKARFAVASPEAQREMLQAKVAERRKAAATRQANAALIAEAEAITRKQAAVRAAKGHGGPLAETYSLIRKAAQQCGKAIEAAPPGSEKARALGDAMRHIHRAEQDVMVALGVEYGDA